MSFSIERPSFNDVHDYQTREPAPSGGKPLFEGSSPSFGDLLDVINPLQHLPVIGTIYRALTGDAMSDGARLAGGALYGGPIGLAVAMANLGLREATGRDFGETALAALTGEEAPAETQETPVQVAAQEPTPPDRAALAPAGLAAAAAQTEPAAGMAMPQLSSDAFDALLRSVNQPAVAPEPTLAQTAAAAASAPATAVVVAKRPTAWTRANPLGAAPVAMPPAVRAAANVRTINPAALNALSGGAAALPATALEAREASLELHNALRLYAQQNGLAPMR